MRAGRFFGISIMVLGLILSAVGESPAAAKKFPTRPIQVIITFAPGATDLLMRPFIEKMPEYLGQPVTFVYKPGAGGSLGAAFVADSKPDGYTLVGSSPSAILVLPLTQKDLRYTLQSFNSHLLSLRRRSGLCRAIQCPLEDDQRTGGRCQEISRSDFIF